MTTELTIKSQGPTNVGAGKKVAASANIRSTVKSAKKGMLLSPGNPRGNGVDG